MSGNATNKLSKVVEQHENTFILVVGIVLALLVRYFLRNHISLDYLNYLESWYDFIAENGGFRALGSEFANYTPTYLYFLALVTIFFGWLPKVVAIKLIAVLFDFICAFFIYKVLKQHFPTGSQPLFASLIFLFAPTVILNSSFWGQSDVVYTTGIIATLYFLLARQERAAFVAFGLAFAFKQQALFLAPFLFILLLKGAVSWRSFLIIPVVYLITIIPAALLGRPIADLLLVYVRQAGVYFTLTMNAPNLYQWLHDGLYDIFVPAGFVFAAAVAFFFATAVYKSRITLTDGVMVQLATISVVIMPYVLPKMHDRYFFMADVLTIVYAFFYPRYFFLPVLVGLTSLFTYLPFLLGIEVIPFQLLAFVPLFTILILFHHLARTVQAQRLAGVSTGSALVEQT